MSDTVEIVNFRLKGGVDVDTFKAENAKMEHAFLGHLHGFKTRSTSATEDGQIAVVLHWAHAEDAQSSMDKFVGNPDTKDFTDLIDMDTFVMTRYVEFDWMTLDDI
ncbi:MAG: hypothetical protein JWO11_1421 [Nocardioides sp.]|nr:hypothetical protein [Nocardioides sp.]